MGYVIALIIIILYIMMAILAGCILEVGDDEDEWFVCALWPLLLIGGLFYLWYRVAKKIAKKIRKSLNL